MEAKILYFSKTSEFFLRMVDSIEDTAHELGIDIYRERRFRDKITFFIGPDGNPYPVSFVIRERANQKEMDIVGRFTIGVFNSDNMYTFGVYSRKGEYGSSLQITSEQHLAWEIHAKIENRDQVKIHFQRILKSFSGKADKIHKAWSTYMSKKNRARALQQYVQKQALE